MSRCIAHDLSGITYSSSGLETRVRRLIGRSCLLAFHLNVSLKQHKAVLRMFKTSVPCTWTVISTNLTVLPMYAHN